MSHTQAFVWSWGAGTRGQLATAAFADSLKPVMLQHFDGSAATPPTGVGLLSDIACGGAHAVATLSLGNEGDKIGVSPGEERTQVLTWGNGEVGALGHGGTEDVSVPKVVEFFSGIRVRSVAAGWSHTAFVSLFGVLYTCGSGLYGQLGHGDFKERLIPCKVELLSTKNVKMAACGMRHTLVLIDYQGCVESGTRVLSFGASGRGQLGLADLTANDEERLGPWNIKKTFSRPEVIYDLTGSSYDQVVKLVAANGDHSAAITNSGDLFIWGRGFCGESDTFSPRPARQARNREAVRYVFTDVALGWNHGLALTDDGVLWAWGSNQRGQLGSISVTEDTEQLWPKMVRVDGLEGKCVMCSAGSEHSAALCENGEVRVWGWGEHGQLGLGNTADAHLPQAVPLPGNFIREKLTWRVRCGSGYTFVVASESV